jgi:hypothetical protein
MSRLRYGFFFQSGREVTTGQPFRWARKAGARTPACPAAAAVPEARPATPAATAGLTNPTTNTTAATATLVTTADRTAGADVTAATADAAA